MNNQVELPYLNVFMAILDREIDVIASRDSSIIDIGQVFTDTYADIRPSDAKLWSRLWSLAVSHGSVSLASAIHIARNGGAVLKPSQKFGYMIHPDYENEKCYWKPEAYKTIQDVFRANQDTLLELLRRL